MNITRRDILLLIVIWAIVGVLALGSIIALRHIRPGPGPSSDQPELTVTSTLVPAYTPVPSQVTAMTQYPLAQEKASGWRQDAQLLSCRGMWEQTAINLVGSGKIDVKSMITTTFTLDQTQEALEYPGKHPGTCIKAMVEV